MTKPFILRSKNNTADLETQKARRASLISDLDEKQIDSVAGADGYDFTINPDWGPSGADSSTSNKDLGNSDSISPTFFGG